MFAPNPIPELLCVDDGGGGALSWVNGDLYETIEVHRDGVLLATLSGEAQGALDETLAAAGAGQFEYLVTPSVEGVAGSSTLCLLAIAPEPVSALTCSPLETGNQLTWQVSTPGDAIEILRDGALVALLGGEETAYLDPVTSIGDSLYEVRTVVDSLPSEGSACTVMRRPVPVSGLICDGGPGGITLSWTNEDVYNAVEVIRNGVVLVTLIGSLETFTDANPETGVMDYTVRALEAGLPSLDSPACQVSLCAATASTRPAIQMENCAMRMPKLTSEMMTTCRASSSEMPRMLPRMMVWTLTEVGLSETSSSPAAKKVVNTRPMIASSRSWVWLRTNAMPSAASRPATKAPNA